MANRHYHLNIDVVKRVDSIKINASSNLANYKKFTALERKLIDIKCLWESQKLIFVSVQFISANIEKPFNKLNPKSIAKLNTTTTNKKTVNEKST